MSFVKNLTRMRAFPSAAQLVYRQLSISSSSLQTSRTPTSGRGPVGDGKRNQPPTKAKPKPKEKQNPVNPSKSPNVGSTDYRKDNSNQTNFNRNVSNFTGHVTQDAASNKASAVRESADSRQSQRRASSYGTGGSSQGRQRQQHSRDGAHKDVQELASDIKSTASQVFETMFNAGNKVMGSVSRVAQQTIHSGQAMASRATDESRALGRDIKRKINIQTLQAQHEPNLNRFSIKIDGCRDPAVLQYHTIGQNKIELYHTEVPEQFRGQGVAAILAKAAFDHAANNQLKMKVTCTYLQDYLKKNVSERYQRLVTDN